MSDWVIWGCTRAPALGKVTLRSMGGVMFSVAHLGFFAVFSMACNG